MIYLTCMHIFVYVHVQLKSILENDLHWIETG